MTDMLPESRKRIYINLSRELCDRLDKMAADLFTDRMDVVTRLVAIGVAKHELFGIYSPDHEGLCRNHYAHQEAS